jgi:hypothetical protein
MKRWLLAGVVGALAVAVLVAVLLLHRVVVPLMLTNAPEVSGDKVTVRYVAHSSDSDPKARVKETAESVTITVTVKDSCGSPGGCTDEGVVRAITVTLREPLGSRTVKDGYQS